MDDLWCNTYNCVIFVSSTVEPRKGVLFQKDAHVMDKRLLLILLSVSAWCYGEMNSSAYADIADEIMVTPVSAAMAGSDLSFGSGASVEATPANLPFDSLNRLALAYAGFYGNIFSTSMLTYTAKPRDDIGIGVLLGYIYIPDIPNTEASSLTQDGGMGEAKIKYFSASKMLFRAGIGKHFILKPRITVSGGIAVNAQRVRLPETGYGIGLDGGIRSFFPKPGISCALQIENLTSSIIYWNKNFQEYAYPRLRAGIGWEKEIDYIYGSMKIGYTTPDLFANDGLNYISRNKDSTGTIIEDPDHFEIYQKPSILFSQGKIGIEYTIMRTVAVRAGLSQGKFGFGAGLRLFHERAGLDLAYINHEALNGTYQLSMYHTW